MLLERHRLIALAGDVAAAHEAGHARRIADDEPGFRVEDHLHEHVAREDLLLDGDTLSAADLDLVLLGHQDLVDLVFHAHGLDAVLEVGLDLLLVAGVRVDDVPALLRARDLREVLEETGHEKVSVMMMNAWRQMASKKPM